MPASRVVNAESLGYRKVAARWFEADRKFVAATVYRNARTLGSRPWNLFDVGFCHPFEGALSLGEPMITLGAAAVPFAWATQDPVATFNWVLAVVAMLSGLAMYLLATSWTGSATAGLVAAILYAFSPAKIIDPAHTFIWDTSWTVFAIFFAWRYIAVGGLRNAVFFAACAISQMGESLYSLVAALLVGGPLLVWMVARNGTAKVRGFEVGLAAMTVAVGGAVVFAPYLLLRANSSLLQDVQQQFFAGWSILVPAYGGTPDLLLIALCIVGVFFWGRHARRNELPDPRVPLLVASLLIIWAATDGLGPSTDELGLTANRARWFPGLYSALAKFVPGLDAIRFPGAIRSGLHLTMTLIAGLGVAALLGHLRRALRRPAGIALVTVAFAHTLLPTYTSFRSDGRLVASPAIPTVAERDFFDTLASSEDAGPMLELPLPRSAVVDAGRIFVSAYQDSPTSACYNSYKPPALQAVRAHVDDLGEEGSIESLRRMGFSTIVLHDLTGARSKRLRNQLDRHVPPGRLRAVLTDERRAAYAIAKD